MSHGYIRAHPKTAHLFTKERAYASRYSHSHRSAMRLMRPAGISECLYSPVIAPYPQMQPQQTFLCIAFTTSPSPRKWNSMDSYVCSTWRQSADRRTHQPPAESAGAKRPFPAATVAVAAFFYCLTAEIGYSHQLLNEPAPHRRVRILHASVAGIRTVSPLQVIRRV